MERKPRRNYDAKKGFEEHIVIISRVTKVVKGRRRFRFAALVVTGDKKGRVSFGTGETNKVPDAIKKAIEGTKKNVFTVPIVGTTIPHAITGRCEAGEVSLRPASGGTGVIAGGPIRAVLGLAGINGIPSECLGGRTPISIVHAAISALKDLETIEKVVRLRGKKPEEIRG